ncbi:MAG: peptidylprolyl isomerase [Oscillospiraceae bacterium]|nr:peptidylprolyl isomerase [Oscillospiraceae bacterium]MBR3536036.1 peptidylprolyl isomerase [Oscillospiraceae bacterium]MBR6836838.1 peptidylprolyl isomerase [Oscillospiraceae bacterium]
MYKKFTAFLAAFAMLSAAVTGCGPTEGSTTTTTQKEPVTTEVTESADALVTEEVSPEPETPVFETVSPLPAASAEITDRRDFIVTLLPEYAPETCKNFEKLVSEGFYNGLSFHRIIDGFMAQGGDPNGNGTGGAKDNIKGEFYYNGVANKLSHTRGVISMARSNDPDSASSQFFICYTDDCTYSLDGLYAAFGSVTEGMEVVDAFLAVPRDYSLSGELSSPQSPVTIKEAVMIDPDEQGHPRVKITMNDFDTSSGDVSEEVTEAETAEAAETETEGNESITESEETAETEAAAE